MRHGRRVRCRRARVGRGRGGARPRRFAQHCVSLGIRSPTHRRRTPAARGGLSGTPCSAGPRRLTSPQVRGLSDVLHCSTEAGVGGSAQTRVCAGQSDVDRGRQDRRAPRWWGGQQRESEPTAQAKDVCLVCGLEALLPGNSGHIAAQATAAFSQRGYNGSSARQIAAAVGITPAAILRHFDSKDELLAAVLKSWAEQTTAAQGDAAIDGLGFWIAQHRAMSYHMEHPGLLQLFIVLAVEASNVDHPARAFMVPRYRHTTDELADHLLSAAARGDIDPIHREDAQWEARALIAYMDGIELQWLFDPRIDLVAEIDRYLSTTFARLGRRSRPTDDVPTTRG